MTPSLLATVAARSALSCALSMSPMSSMSHSILVPADNMMASTPQCNLVVVAPFSSFSLSEKATMGKVPDVLRDDAVGAVVPVYMSSMPPVPKVILVLPGVMQPCPTKDACWSPTSAAMGRLSNSVAWPTTCDDATMVGSAASGIFKIPQILSDQFSVSTEKSPVTPALVWSVTKDFPAVNFHVSQVSMVPMQISPRRISSCNCAP